MSSKPVARLITAEERDHYQEHGWVFLKRLIDPDAAGALLERVKKLMGENGEHETREWEFAKIAPGADLSKIRYKPYVDPAADDDLLASFAYSNELGSVASHVLGGMPVKRWNNQILMKQKASADGHFSAESGWHQDLPALPHDRIGRPNLWLALNEITPERGSLRFLNNMGKAGLVEFDRKESPVPWEALPDLLEKYPLGPELHYEPGDATVHELPTFHFALANTTDEHRWVYVHTYVRADARFTGGPSNRVTGLDLTVGEEFPEDEFALIEPLTPSWEVNA
jgi:ectoine hydroxylase-related dioxygenase (phytanoyl-CoA dioxygenase family)